MDHSAQASLTMSSLPQLLQTKVSGLGVRVGSGVAGIDGPNAAVDR